MPETKSAAGNRHLEHTGNGHHQIVPSSEFDLIPEQELVIEKMQPFSVQERTLKLLDDVDVMQSKRIVDAITSSIDCGDSNMVTEHTKPLIEHGFMWLDKEKGEAGIHDLGRYAIKTIRDRQNSKENDDQPENGKEHIKSQLEELREALVSAHGIELAEYSDEEDVRSSVRKLIESRTIKPRPLAAPRRSMMDFFEISGNGDIKGWIKDQDSPDTIVPGTAKDAEVVRETFARNLSEMNSLGWTEIKKSSGKTTNIRLTGLGKLHLIEDQIREELSSVKAKDKKVSVENYAKLSQEQLQDTYDFVTSEIDLLKNHKGDIFRRKAAQDVREDSDPDHEVKKINELSSSEILDRLPALYDELDRLWLDHNAQNVPELSFKDWEEFIEARRQEATSLLAA